MVPLTSRSELNITVKIYILRVSQDDLQKEYYWMDLTLRQFWTDPRFIINSFTYSDKVIMGGIEMTDLIWPPATLVNEKMTLTTMKKRTIQHGDLLRIRTINGQVMLSQQIKTKTKCKFSYSLLPINSYICDITIKSINNNIAYHWKDGDRSVVASSLPDFFVYKTELINTTGTVKSLVQIIHISSQYIQKINIPAGAIVLFSWSSFWISPHKPGWRIFIGFLALIIIMSIKTWVNIILMKITDIVYITIYLDMCLLMVTLALVQFLILIAIIKTNKEKLDQPVREWSQGITKAAIDDEVNIYLTTNVKHF